MHINKAMIRLFERCKNRKIAVIVNNFIGIKDVNDY